MKTKKWKTRRMEPKRNKEDELKSPGKEKCVT